MAHIVYDLYESRGKAESHDLADWLEAARIISESGNESEQKDK
jgi:hypothetical protein